MINNHFPVCHVFQYEVGRATETNITSSKPHLQICSFNKLILRPYYVPGGVPAAEDTDRDKFSPSPGPHRPSCLLGGRDRE